MNHMEKWNLQKGFTHAGHFHADDVFATALLRILNPDITIERGYEVPDGYDGIVYDIGRGYFDHHQEDKEVRENGVPYAAFGLLWREFGAGLIGEQEAARYDEKFIQPLDEADNTGCDHPLASVISEYNIGWDSDASEDEAFWRAVRTAEEILNNHFDKVKGFQKAEKLVCAAMQEGDGKVLILPCFAPWKDCVVESSYQLVIYPSNRGGYCIQGVPISRGSRELVCKMPDNWCGKSAEELALCTGIEGFSFCHPTGFLASVKTLEEAKKLAQMVIALHSEESTENQG